MAFLAEARKPTFIIMVPYGVPKSQSLASPAQLFSGCNTLYTLLNFSGLCLSLCTLSVAEQEEN